MISFIRKIIRWINRLRLKNSNFTLITNNCLGGVICHDLHCRFDSPTINLDFEDCGFIIFCNNLEYYLSLSIEEVNTKNDFPVGIIHGIYGDVKIHFRHYKTFGEAMIKWKERVKRIHWDNIFVIMECGFEHDTVLCDFDKIPFKNKVLYTAYDRTYNVQHSIRLPRDFYSVDFYCGKLLQYSGRSIFKNYEILDFVRFINTGKICKNIFFKWL